MDRDRDNGPVLALLLWLAAAMPAAAQGFAGLGGEAGGFAVPDRHRPVSLPADHGPHPEFRIEWWYLTANLTGPDGRDHGVQWTLLRTALAPGDAPGWDSPQIWLGHAAVTSAGAHRFAERRGRGGIGQAGATASPFAAWIDDWEMTGTDDLSRLRLRARATDFAYDLSLAAERPPVLHGERGYSVKSAEGQASHYYSQPFDAVLGTLTLPEGTIAVTGQGWLDREWSSQPLSADQDGWDWFSLHLDDGARLMAFRLRGARGNFLSGTWIAPDGTSAPLSPDAVRVEPLAVAQVAGRTMPVRWRLQVPDRGLDLSVAALNPQSWMGTAIPYWEGPVRVTGSHTGRGYLEMTGYE